MKIEVDWELCEANAVCVGLAPDVFEVDDHDKLHLLVVEPNGEAQLAKVREAVRRCPRNALRLAE